MIFGRCCPAVPRCDRESGRAKLISDFDSARTANARAVWLIANGAGERASMTRANRANSKSRAKLLAVAGGYLR
jgi:hypothetical protein